MKTRFEQLALDEIYTRMARLVEDHGGKVPTMEEAGSFEFFMRVMDELEMTVTFFHTGHDND